MCLQTRSETAPLGCTTRHPRRGRASCGRTVWQGEQRPGAGVTVGTATQPRPATSTELDARWPPFPFPPSSPCFAPSPPPLGLLAVFFPPAELYFPFSHYLLPCNWKPPVLPHYEEVPQHLPALAQRPLQHQPRPARLLLQDQFPSLGAETPVNPGSFAPSGAATKQLQTRGQGRALLAPSPSPNSAARTPRSNLPAPHITSVLEMVPALE